MNELGAGSTTCKPPDSISTTARPCSASPSGRSRKMPAPPRNPCGIGELGVGEARLALRQQHRQRGGVVGEHRQRRRAAAIGLGEPAVEPGQIVRRPTSRARSPARRVAAAARIVLPAHRAEQRDVRRADVIVGEQGCDRAHPWSAVGDQEGIEPRRRQYRRRQLAAPARTARRRQPRGGRPPGRPKAAIASPRPWASRCRAGR